MEDKDKKPTAVVVEKVKPKFHAEKCPVCFDENHFVLTEQGYKQISKIKTGEKVYTRNGLRKITKVFKRKYQGELVDISTYGVRNLLSPTSNHPFFIVKNTNDGKKRVKFKTLSSKFIKDNWMVSPANGITTHDSLMTPILNIFGESDKFTVSFENEKYIIDEDFAWMAGWYIAEGYSKPSDKNDREFGFALCVDEKDVAERLINYFSKLGINGKISTHSVSKKAIYVRFCSAKWTRFLSFYLGNRSETRRIPSFFFNKASKKLWETMVDAYFLGDGFIRIKRKEKSANTISKILALDLYTLLVLLKKDVYLLKHPAVKNKWAKERKDYYILWYPINQNQQARCRIFIDNLYIHQVKSIKTRKVSTFVYNLEVEEDNEYIVNGVLVHNCNGFGSVNYGKAECHGCGGTGWILVPNF